MSNKHRKLSRKGAIFIGRFEGWVPTLYDDLAGDAHIGFGHKLHDGPWTQADVNKWDPPISKSLGLALLQEDAEQAAAGIRELVDVDLRQGQFDALVSFVFNLGVGAFNGTQIPELLNAGRPQDARRELLKYDHVGTVRYAGLTRRRRAEARLFRTGFYFLAKL